MSRFVQSQWLPRPLDEVFAFFSRAENLESITPSWIKFRIVSPTPVKMGEGALIDYRLRVHGIPLRWQSLIEVWEPPFRFVDSQTRGPYRKWHHEHLFSKKDGGTLVEDRVEYKAPGGAIMDRFFVRPDVERIFAHRSQALLEMFGDRESSLTSMSGKKDGQSVPLPGSDVVDGRV